jgi:hypothetical protein
MRNDWHMIDFNAIAACSRYRAQRIRSQQIEQCLGSSFCEQLLNVHPFFLPVQ